MTTLYNKYRPQKWADVVGQTSTVKALSKLIEKKQSQAFLLSGPSGTGKTTLSRIAAKEADCHGSNIIEIAAAVYTGVDAMREVLDGLQYKGFGKTEGKAIIVDEAHRLSKSAWDSLLKAIEEPSKHVFWFLCTTELDKVPKTIQTRCSHFDLKPVNKTDLERLCEDIADAEKFKISDAVITLVTKEAKGSVRQALVNLALCSDLTDRKEAAEILKSAIESEGIVELARFLLKGGTWKMAMKIVERLKDENAESCRIVIVNYMAAVAKNSEGDMAACRALSILDAFSVPFNSSENQAPLLNAIGKVLFTD